MIPDQIPAHDIAGVSGYLLGDGKYALAFVDVDGETHAFKVSRSGLQQVFMYIGHMLEPGAVDALPFYP